MAFRSTLVPVWLVASICVAHAGCKEDVAQLEDQSQHKATAAVANSSGGQATAARREAPQQGQGGGDEAMQAKVALNDAKVALGKGDETACAAAIQRARGHVEK
jgi:hypothetical protein